MVSTGRVDCFAWSHLPKAGWDNSLVACKANPRDETSQQNWAACYIKVFGADGRSRTGTAYATTPSRWRVYQFHHIGNYFLYKNEDLLQ